MTLARAWKVKVVSRYDDGARQEEELVLALLRHTAGVLIQMSGRAPGLHRNSSQQSLLLVFRSRDQIVWDSFVIILCPIFIFRSFVSRVK